MSIHPLHFFTLPELVCIILYTRKRLYQAFYITYNCLFLHAKHKNKHYYPFPGISNAAMPENESWNQRLVTQPRAFQSSYNVKEPRDWFPKGPSLPRSSPEFLWVSRALLPKGSIQVPHERNALESKLTFIQTAHANTMEKAQHKLNTEERHYWLQTQVLRRS